jgi:hypothetical protein
MLGVCWQERMPKGEFDPPLSEDATAQAGDTFTTQPGQNSTLAENPSARSAHKDTISARPPDIFLRGEYGIYMGDLPDDLRTVISCVSWASPWPHPQLRRIGRRVTFRGLFVFVLLAHERWRIVHGNITEHPTAPRTAQQMIEALPWDTAPRDLLRDRDAVSGAIFQSRAKNLDIEEVKIAPRSPRQHPYCEWGIGGMRRDALDHVIVLNEPHLRWVLRTYMAYDHTWRVHRSLGMDASEPRTAQSPELGPVRKFPEVGSLHHHYERIAA